MNDTPSDQNAQPELETPCPPDQRVLDALEEKGVPYEIDEETGDFSVLVECKDDRTQDVIIRSGTREFMGVEMRDIISIALISQGPFDARTANLLLRENTDVGFGSWQIFRDDDNTHIAIFCMNISASLRAESLVELICMVASTADEIEHRLSGLDQY